MLDQTKELAVLSHFHDIVTNFGRWITGFQTVASKVGVHQLGYIKTLFVQLLQYIDLVDEALEVGEREAGFEDLHGIKGLVVHMIADLDPNDICLLRELAFSDGDQRAVHSVDLGSAVDVLNKLVVELRNHSL